MEQGLPPTAGGIAAGVFGAFALQRAIRHLLFEVSPTDATAWVGATVVLAAVAVLASYLPARRAARVDPMVALRSE